MGSPDQHSSRRRSGLVLDYQELVEETDGQLRKISVKLASDLHDNFRRTRSLHLYADFEVAQTHVITSRQEDEEEEWREAIETLKMDYGFAPRGGRELGTCSICLDDICCGNKKLIQTLCSHLYHESCIVSWLEKNNSSCPLCRAQVLY